MKYVICFLVCLLSLDLLALVPLEGIVFGNVKDIKQYDPFTGVVNFSNKYDGIEKSDLNKLDNYYALYKQGTNLKYQCEKDPKTNYSSSWSKSTAARSIGATLQFIGLDLTLKAITQYAKKLEYTDGKFKLLVNNLIKNTCSKNLSVYSLRLLKNNFFNEWTTGNDSYLPNIKESKFFTKDFKQKQNTLEVAKKEFNYTLRNFRAFCSWNSDASDFRLLVPYLKNPYIMSNVFNNLEQKKISIDHKTREIKLIKNEKGIQVACENMICRKRNKFEFQRIFPRMIGSSSLKIDLSNLYCDHFLSLRYKRSTTNSQIKKWIKEQTFEEPKLEVLNFISLLTKIPDPLITASEYVDIHKYFAKSLQKRWDSWANGKIEQFHNDHLYEEPLEITLVEQRRSGVIQNGEFNIIFDIGLSEIDKVLEGIDKIDVKLNLNFPIKYLAFVRERIIFLEKNGKDDEAELIRKKLIGKIAHQMKLKQNYFKIPVWNEQISTFIGGEILGQIDNYHGEKFKRLSNEKINIPIKLRFGVFALQYIRQRYNYNQKKKKALTFN